MRRNKTALLVALLTIVVAFLGPTTAQEAKQITCEGRIVDAKSQPVEGATVALYVYGRETNSFSYGTRPTVQVTTRSDGSFSISVLADRDNYTYGYVVAQKEGLALGWASWNMRTGSVELEIELGQPNTLAGIVVEENGKPVSGAQVSIYMLLKGKQYLTSPVAPTLLRANTDPKGKFTFGNLPLETTADFVVAKTGYATINTSMASSQPRYAVGQTDIKLVLPAEAKIEGAVVEKETGKPMAGVKLIVKEGNRWAQDAFNSREDGTFSINSLAPGKYSLELLPPGPELAEWVAERVEVTTEAGKTQSGVRIELIKGSVLEVMVTDAISGRPVEKANVGVLHEATSRYSHSLSGRDGIARIRLTAGEYLLLNGVYREGYSPQGVEERITIVNDKTERIDYALFPESKITGTVRDEKGKPLEGATLMVWPSERQQEAVTSREGKFAITYDVQNLSGGEIPLLLICRYLKSNLAAALQINGDTRALDVTLKPGVTFTGNVVDPDGRGIVGAKLRVDLCKPGLDWPIEPTEHAQITTHEEGRYEIKAVPRGHKYRLYMEAEGYGRNSSGEINTDDIVGNQLDIGSTILAVANLSVSGVVVDESGKPAADVTVNTYSSDQPTRVVRTGVDGRFKLDGVCAGRILILAGKYGTGLHGSIITDVGTTDAKIVISDKPSRPHYVPKQPPSLVGKPLPGFDGINIDLAPDASKDKWMLLCFFDMTQRPSRNCITQLAKQVGQLKEKGVAVVAVQAAKIEQKKLDEWVKENNVYFPVGMIRGDEEKIRFNWGVQSLPWLILINSEHIVRAEGFSIAELGNKSEIVSGK